MKIRNLLFAALLGLGAATSAQPAERVLIPVSVFKPVPGAHGSVWQTELIVSNFRDDSVTVKNVSAECTWLCPDVVTLLPHETLALVPTGSGLNNGALVEAPELGGMAFQLRVRDLSRQALTWGTEIPVIREQQMLTGTIMLTNVPVSSSFRNTLRIFEIDNRLDAEVRVRLYAIGPNRPGEQRRVDVFLGEQTRRFVAPPAAMRTQVPAYILIGDLNEIAPVGRHQRVNVEIVPATEGLRLWAFVSVTNNETQHVTTVTPQQR